MVKYALHTHCVEMPKRCAKMQKKKIIYRKYHKIEDIHKRMNP